MQLDGVFFLVIVHSVWELAGIRLPPFLLTPGSPKDACLAHCFTHDCCAFFPSNHIVKFADDTTVLGLINNNDETAYRNEVQHLALWCDNNSLVLNIKKTKEIIVDFRKTGQYNHSPLSIGNEGWREWQVSGG